MAYEILIDELVLTDDFKRIELHHQQRILKAIRERLGTDPEKCGRPLRGELKGLWKLRVGEFRVIYEIQKEQVVVYVIKIGLRRNDEVYRAVLKRSRGSSL
ncbi:MAG: plasmid stabilization system protein [Candidatus Aminicenantes bacterium]|jgi:mRNA interferase RelE/StbE|nr:plasmid stabilization system protein [Candidatus Aminicenantes bacterium]